MAATADKPFMEGQVMKVMLDTVLYVHMPFEQKGGVLRFAQFVRPDGKTVLPFFSDRAQALEAAAGHMDVVPILGRNLFALTQGATLMLDPNERGDCVFYPEELAALLAGGSTGMAQPWQSDSPIRLTPARDVPKPLINGLRSACASLSYISAAYIAFAQWQDAIGAPPVLLVAIVTDKSEHEHAVRAISAALQPHVRHLQRAVDLTTIELEKTNHPMIRKGRLVYRKDHPNNGD